MASSFEKSRCFILPHVSFCPGLPYLFNEKTAFVDKSSVEPTIFFIEKTLFSLKLFSGHFHGQFFIKTVRGPYALYHVSSALCK